MEASKNESMDFLRDVSESTPVPEERDLQFLLKKDQSAADAGAELGHRLPLHVTLKLMNGHPGRMRINENVPPEGVPALIAACRALLTEKGYTLL